MTFDSQSSNSPPETYDTKRAKPSLSALFVCAFAVTMLSACGPSLANDGSDGFGETAGDGDPMPGTDEICVEMTQGSVTCWVDWSPGVHARVVLECQAAANVSAGDWDPPVEQNLSGWGLTLCYEVVSTGSQICVWGDSRARLTWDSVIGAWTPTLDPSVSLFDEVEPPCGAEPGDGDGDPMCNELGCLCESGECMTDLVCDLSGQCSTCPPGDPGCPCGGGDCEVGQCYSGQDIDGTSWSICYPADLLGCVDGVCPGDAYCTDSLKCAWSN